MDAMRLRRVMDLFREACLLDLSDRSAFLDAQCAGDAELRDRVDALLAEDSRSIGPVDLPGGGVPILARQIVELTEATAPCLPSRDSSPLPVLSGDYRVIRVIGQGGMGTVYEAEQAMPRRRVALKAIRQGLTSPQLVRRFEHEAHILGRLHHPGIAQIYEAGAADAEHLNLAFIAMEYVDGPPLTEFCDQRALNVRDRVALLIKVCDAVHHAHQRGVIHRDLKPTNVLVDPSGQPKVLDFGVARAIDAADTDLTTMHTSAGQLVGTLAYMSPEQVAGDPAEVDLRSDVYALGVILFRTLTGRLPYDLSKQSIPQIARIIRETEAVSLAMANRSLRGDLETIAAKALDKDKHRRYQSAAELQSDLQAYLDGAPIAARRDSALYVLRKNLRRYKFAAAAASLFLVGSIGASLALSAMYRESTRQAETARLAQIKAERAENEQRIEAERARVEARKFDRINQLLQNMLIAAEPDQTRGRDVSVRELLDRSAASVHMELRGEPEIEAAVRTTIGNAYAGLGLFDPAEEHLREALAIRQSRLGADHPDVADTSLALARVLRETDRLDEAYELCKHAMDVNARTHGREHEVYARSLVLYADLLQYGRNQYATAEQAYREAMDIYTKLYGPRNPRTAAVAGNLGAMLLTLFRYADAEPVMREAYETALELHGPNHSVVIMNGHNLAYLLAERGRSADAEAIAQQTLDGALQLYGPDHPETARNMLTMAQLLRTRGEIDRAEQLARSALTIRQSKLPPGHHLINWAAVQLADILAARGSPEAGNEAESLVRAALSDYAQQNASEHWPAAEARSVLGASLVSQGQYAEAETLLMASCEELKLKQGPRSRAVHQALHRIVHLYEAIGREDLASEYRTTLANLPSR